MALRSWLVLRWRRIAIVAAVMAFAWTGIAGFALPAWLKPRIEAEASKALGAPLVMERFEISPWRLAARAHGLVLGPPDAPWLKLAEAEVNLSTRSLLHLAPVIERLTLREPRVELERVGPGRFNVSPMLDALKARPPSPPDAKPPRFAVNNIRIEGGQIHVVDRVSKTEHRVDAIAIGIPFLSNLPNDVAIDVEPRLEARVDGAPLLLTGKTQPFGAGLRSSVSIDWRDIDLAFWAEAIAPLLPRPLPLEVEKGRLALQLELAFERQPAPTPSRLHLSGGLAVRDFDAAVPERGLAAGFEQLDVSGIDAYLLLRRGSIAKIALRAPHARVDLPRLMTAAPSPAAAEPAQPSASAASAADAAASAPVSWQIGEVAIEQGRVSLVHPAWRDGEAIGPLALNVTGLASDPQATPAKLRFDAADAHGASVHVEGDVQPMARKATLAMNLAGLDARAWLVPWQELLPVRVQSGVLAAKAQIGVDGRALRVSEGSAELVDLQLLPATSAAPEANVPAKASQPKGRGKGKVPDRTEVDRLALAKLELAGLDVELQPDAAPRVHVQRLAMSKLVLDLLRGTEGRLAWLVKPAKSGDAGVASGEGKAEPSVLLDELRCIDCRVNVVDRAVTPAAQFGLERVELVLRHIGNDLSKPFEFEYSSLTQRVGRLKLSGQLRPRPLALRSKIDIANLDVRAVQGYIDPYLNVAVASARVAAAGELDVQGSVEQPLGAVRWRGRAAVSELRTLDRINSDAEFVRFKTLRADGLDIDWSPAQLTADLGNVSLADFYARVIINADGRINLGDMVKRRSGDAARSITTPDDSPAEAASAPAAPAEPASGPTAAASAPPGLSGKAAQLRWRGIELRNGQVDFTDNFVRPNYSARLGDLAGKVSAVAWNDPQPATVEVSGKVDGAAPLSISGTLHPLGPRLYTDIAAEARGIELTRLSTYSARYAGYGIEKGTLSVKVRYKVENGQLQAENNLYLDQLTFGEKVDSPSALKLPVLLAVSLLKDRNGVIDVNLPVSGSLDDPQFSIGGIIFKVIVNLIGKALTAPFSLLASAFGGGQELGFVEFAPGSAEIGESQRQRLDTLAKALNDRPALKLEATGVADPAQDEAGLRRAHLERQMRAQKAKAEGELPESVRIEPGERDKWLEAAYKSADLKGKPRNFVGMAKSVPPAEMEQLLLAGAPVGPAELKALADERGNRVKGYLIDKVPPERVLLTSSKVGTEAPKDGGKSTRVQFSLK